MQHNIKAPTFYKALGHLFTLNLDDYLEGLLLMVGEKVQLIDNEPQYRCLIWQTALDSLFSEGVRTFCNYHLDF